MEIAATTSGLPRSQRWQFSIRALGVLVTGLAVWLAIETNAARRQEGARKLIIEHGGQPLLDYQILGTTAPLVPRMLRHALGEDLFADVVRLNFPPGKPDSDECLTALTRLPSVTVINTERSAISDVGLQEICRANLDCLRLIRAQITDDGLRHLVSLSRLQLLDLSHNRITDEGLKHLARIKTLEYLTLTGAAVSDVGIQELDSLAKLKYLNLQQTQVSEAGAQSLRQRLPNCQIEVDRR